MKNIIFSFITLLLVLAPIDVFLRFTSVPQEKEMKHYILDEAFTYYAVCFKTKPVDKYVMWTDLKWPQERIERHKVQFLETPFCIDHDLELRRTSRKKIYKKKFLITGDSFTFGEGDFDEESPLVLFEETFKDFAFDSVAKSGLNMLWATSRAYEYLVNSDVKDVIYIMNLNDMEPIHDKPLNWRIFDFQNVKFDQMNLSQDKGLYGFLVNRLTAFLMTQKNIFDYKSHYFSDSHKERREEFKASLSRLIELSGEKKGSVRIVIYPLLFKSPTGGYPFKDIHQEIMKWCQEWKIVCFDAQSFVDEIQDINTAVVHKTDLHPNGKTQRFFLRYLKDQLSFEKSLNDDL